MTAARPENRPDGLAAGVPRPRDVSKAPGELPPHLDRQLHLARAVDLLPAMVGYWDTELRNRAANADYLGWFGLTPEQTYGRHIREVIGEDLYRKNLPFMRAALAGEAQHFDREIVDVSGARRHTQASYLPDVDPVEGVRGFAVLVADVTARVEAERALAAEQQRVARLTEKLRVVGTLSASLRQDDPDAVQDAVAEAVIALGFDGAVVVLSDGGDVFRPRFGRGIFADLDGTRVSGSTVSGEVMRDAELRVVEDYQAFDLRQPAVGATGVRTVVAVPVQTGDTVLGVLHAGRLTVAPLEDDDREALLLLAAVAGTTLRYARSFLDLRHDQERLTEIAMQDPLTGLGNRRVGDALLANARPGDAVVALDLDHFKRVNDTRGHAMGDILLQRLGHLLLDRIRRRDHAVRMGGEEFLVFLPGTSAEVAGRLVERLRTHWAREQPWTTFSAGIAVVEHGETGRSAHERADAALYAAKRGGRDRFVFAAARPPAT